MPTELTIDGTRFLINGRPTHEGREHRGRSVEGLLMNSRMIQAIFDDACEETRPRWAYPDTGVWDPERNTDEFCAALPEYRRHGLLAFTVGLQGGGPYFGRPEYGKYRNTAFTPEGLLKPDYAARLGRVLKAADDAGMVAIVSLFYWVEAFRIPDLRIVERIVDEVCGHLLESGHRNIIVELANEVGRHWKAPFGVSEVPALLERAKAVRKGGRRLLVGCSHFPHHGAVPDDAWLGAEDVTIPHGNDHTPAQLRAGLRRLRATAGYRARPRPVVVNEDSVFLDNLEVAVEEGASWGLYHQGWGSGYRDRRMDWTLKPRETDYARLTGFQTVPVNWTINDPWKRAFFDRVREITGGT